LFLEIVRAAIGRARVGCVLDVGAHRGEFAIGLRRAGYGGPIVSFEPNPSLPKMLHMRASRDAAWRVYSYGLGLADGEAILHRPRETSFASTRESLPYGCERFGADTVPSDAIKIPVRRLDGVFADTVDGWPLVAREAPVLLKIDAQGSDLDIFAGAAGILPRVEVVVMEFSLIPLYAGVPSFADALRQVEDAGFHLAGLVPVAHDNVTGAVVELDGCLVRGSHEGIRA
jgi:FkbM family methyltransferase